MRQNRTTTAIFLRVSVTYTDMTSNDGQVC